MALHQWSCARDDKSLCRPPANPPKGLAFAIDDLLRMREWTDRHGMRMVIHLDHGVRDEEYEEVIAFHTNIRSSCVLLIWRSSEAVNVQPLVGRSLTYRSVDHVLDSLVANRDAEMTDTTAHE